MLLSFAFNGVYYTDIGLLIAFPFSINYTMDLISELRKEKRLFGFGGFLLLIVCIPVNIFGAFMFVSVLSFLIWEAIGVVKF